MATSASARTVRTPKPFAVRADDKRRLLSVWHHSHVLTSRNLSDGVVLGSRQLGGAPRGRAAATLEVRRLDRRDALQPERVFRADRRRAPHGRDRRPPAVRSPRSWARSCASSTTTGASSLVTIGLGGPEWDEMVDGDRGVLGSALNAIQPTVDTREAISQVRRVPGDLEVLGNRGGLYFARQCCSRAIFAMLYAAIPYVCGRRSPNSRASR